MALLCRVFCVSAVLLAAQGQPCFADEWDVIYAKAMADCLNTHLPMGQAQEACDIAKQISGNRLVRSRIKLGKSQVELGRAQEELTRQEIETQRKILEDAEPTIARR